MLSDIVKRIKSTLKIQLLIQDGNTWSLNDIDKSFTCYILQQGV